MPEATKRIVIEPLTRVEGHGKVSILLDDDNRVAQARLHIVEFRGFERFIQTRPFWEALVALLNNQPVELPYPLLKYD